MSAGIARKLILIESNGNQRECIIHASAEEPWYIEIEDVKIGQKKFEGSDLFVCLINLRLYLEQRKCLLLCNGSRIDVYPSGMSREMSGGRLAYITKIGNVTNRGDIVDIFEETGIAKIGTVIQQKEYHSRWINSIKKL
jgi:hypothetical protein